MKSLKITLALVGVLLLTVSGVKSEDIVTIKEPTYKKYNSQDLLVIDKKKLKVVTHG